MSMFGVPQEKLELAGDPKGGKDLVEYLAPTIRSTFSFSEKTTIDHGSFVPLYFFSKTFSLLPSIVIANPIGLTYPEAYNAGVALRDLMMNEHGLFWQVEIFLTVLSLVDPQDIIQMGSNWMN